MQAKAISSFKMNRLEQILSKSLPFYPSERTPVFGCAQNCRSWTFPVLVCAAGRSRFMIFMIDNHSLPGSIDNT